MKPFGREKKIKGANWKKDCHPKKLGKGWLNWWEVEMDTFLTRSRMKQILNKEIKKL